MTNTKLLLATAAALATTTAAYADPKPAKPLDVKVYTGSPGGFLVDSALVTGEKEAILIDAQFTLADAHRLVAMILESGKTLTTVYVTHDHPDHYFGLAVIHQAFPNAKLVARASTVAAIKKTAADKVKQWQGMYGSNIPARPVLPVALAEPKLVLEGQTLEIHGAITGDDADNSYVWIPSAKTVIAGDIVFHGVHAWTASTTREQRQAWLKSLDEIAALHPATVIAGHHDPKLAHDTKGLEQTRSYLETFDAAVAASKTSAEVQQKVNAKYGDLQLGIILQLGADAAFKK